MFHRYIKWLLITLISLTITLYSSRGIAQTSPLEQEQQGRTFYQTYHYQQARQIWQKAAQTYQEKGDQISQARVLSNLALAAQQIGEWEQAKQAIAKSLTLINQANPSPKELPVLAQILNNQGLIEFAKDQPENALQTWEKASQIYQKIPDKIGYLRSQINQTKALHFMGLHPRACSKISQALELQFSLCPSSEFIPVETQTQTQKLLQDTLANLPQKLDSVTLLAWYNLAEELRDTEYLEIAQNILQQILPKAQTSEDRTTILLSLGKLTSSQKQNQEAFKLYYQAEKEATHPLSKVLVKLYQLELFRVTEQWLEITPLIATLSTQLSQLPANQDTIYAQINFVNNIRLIKQEQPQLNLPSWLELAKILANAVQQAKIIESPRTEAYALGNLGTIYEQTQQLDMAQRLTEKALLISQSLNTPETIYYWQWQLGRILEAKGEREKAISIYSEAVTTLELIKQDLVAVNRNIQFSFAAQVEPVYRELVSLLLHPNTQGNIPQENLRQARDVIESLQLAELNNFLQETCLEVRPKSIDQIDQQAAVIYPIILSDRLEIILSLPQQPLKRYVTFVSATELKSVALKLRQTLVIRSRREFYAPAKQIYQWLISPLEADLKNAQIKTLVFILDGALRNIPMTTLYDGKQYLMEKYEVALTPGLQLLSPQPLRQTSLQTLGAGVSQARAGFSPLFFVNQELNSIRENVKSQILLNKEFTTKSFKNELLNDAFPIVHIATHGQFSSNFEKTFLLAWDSKINIRQLDTILKGKSNSQNGAIELLVLSACETATGDEKAALGLAGMAVRSGARSTIATLWSVNDEATAELMNSFYSSLATEKISKSRALREAQLKLLGNLKYRHPFYWSSYVLLGNWL